MIVGIDAKRIVRNGTGLGSYGRTLVNDLIRLGDSDMPLTKGTTSCAARLSRVLSSVIPRAILPPCAKLGGAHAALSTIWCAMA